MAIITVASPDKLSISMFISFMRFCLGNDHKIGALQSLQTVEDIEKYIENHISTTDKVIFSYYAKRKINIDPLLVIPKKLMEISEMVIWIDLFSTEWKVLKDMFNQAPILSDRWKKNMEKMTTESV